MRTFRFFSTFASICVFAFVLCGCSGGGGIIAPSYDETDGSENAVPSNFSIDSRLQADPRFEGYTDYSGDRNAATINYHPLSIPYCRPPEYDKFLFGTITDPNAELDPLTLIGNIDDTIDISSILRYRVQKLPYGGIRYVWRCVTPDEVEDFNYHQVTLQIESAEGRSWIFTGSPFIKTDNPPTIGYVVYPWKSAADSFNDNSSYDPMKMLVVLSHPLLDEWKAFYADTHNWNIEGTGNPISAEITADQAAVILTLAQSIENSAYLTLGPFSYMENVISDTEFIEGNGGNFLDHTCYCNGLDAETLDIHQHFEKERSAWAMYLTQPAGCYISKVEYQKYRWIINDDPMRSFDQEEDYSTLSEEYETFSSNIHASTNVPFTNFISTNKASSYDVCFSAGCTIGEIQTRWTETLVADFDADVINPLFSEEPRIVSGPEAAKWLINISESSNVYPEAFFEQAVEYMDQDECGAYLLIDYYDPGSPASIGSFYLDILDSQGEFKPDLVCPGIGGGLWIDNDTPYYNEYLDWPDPSHDPLRVDAWKEFEEYATAINVDSLFYSGDLSARVRIHDSHGNWRRSGDLLAQDAPDCSYKGDNTQKANESYQVLDIFFRDNNRFTDENDECSYPNNAPPNRREGCDGYVAPRPGGDIALDVVAVVTGPEYLLPDNIIIELSAPADESEQASLYVLLYELDEECPDYEIIREDYLCDAQNPYAFCLAIYCRGMSGRSYVNDCEPGLVHATDFENTSESDAGHPIEGGTPYLYVSSDDTLISEPGGDFKDWSAAIGNADDGTHDWEIWNSTEIIAAVHYGTGMRGIYERDPSPLSAGLNQGCSTPTGDGTDYNDNYKDNVLTFGFEWIKAQSESGMQAFYPVQSQADIMFILSHGRISGLSACKGEKANTDPYDPDKEGWSYLRLFPDTPNPPFKETSPPNDIIYSEDFEAFLGSNPDADWLALIACWMLADSSDCCNFANPYIEWQNMLINTSMKSIFGFRTPHKYEYYRMSSPYHPNLETMCSETVMWTTLCDRLEQGNYEPHPEIWHECNVADEYGVMCYMETAWEFGYYYDIYCGPWSYVPDYDARRLIINACAIDEVHRYIFSKCLDINSPYYDKYIIYML